MSLSDTGKLIIIVLLCAAGALFCQDTSLKRGEYQSKEPSVTRKEADLLAEVKILIKSDPEKAAALLSERLKPLSSPAFDFALGTVYLHKGDLEQAAASYRNALKKLPEFSRARVNLASVYLRLDKPEQAVRELRQALQGGRRDSDTLTLLGYAFLQGNRAVHAETAYRQALLLEPDDDNIRLGLAESLLLQERFREAAALLEDLLEKIPNDSRIWLLYANTHMSLENYMQAAVSLECAVRLGIATPEAMATLGDLYMNQDQPLDALRVYQKAFSAKEPSIARMVRAAEGFTMTGNLDGADVLIKKAYRLYRENPDSFTSEQYSNLCYTQARCYHLKGKRNEAVSAYEGLLKKDPLNGKALLALGDLKRETGNLEEAKILYERAERIQETKVEALVRQAQVEIDREHYRKAVKLLESAEIIDPDPRIARFLKQVKRLAELTKEGQ